MRSGKRIGVVMMAVGLLFSGMLPAVISGRSAVALSEADYYKYSENNIYFYDPTSCRTGVSNSSQYNNLVIGADTSQAERMANVVKQYGELAMDLQREWGTPWEVVFAQMEMESNTGTNLNSIAGRVAANGYFNWLGITGSGGSYSEGIPPYQGSDREWAQFPTVENMIKAWAGSYIARNGYYNKAFSHLDPGSYDLRGFLNDFIMVYAPPKENDTSRYITSVISFIEGPIKTAREEMGWPSSEELAIRENIPIGGRHPVGSDTSNSALTNAGGCTILRSAPDYNSSDYQGRLSNLHNFSQVYGQFSSKKLCGSNSSTISGAGCGLMSLAAAYYMFSGMGLNDESFIDELLAQAKADGYNQCDQSATDNFGSNLSSYLNMTKENASGLDWDTLVGYLKQGKKVLVSSGTEYFTRSSGHIMMLDHYDTGTDTIYMFDPAIMADRVAKLDAQIAVNQSGYITYHGAEGSDGLSMSRKAMDELVQVRAARVLTYNGCYNGGVDICRSSYTGLKSGGMTLDEAEAFLSNYIEEAKKENRGAYGQGYPNGTVIGSGWVNDAVDCKFGALNNCSALSQWFVNNYTTAGPNVRSWNGGEFASGLITTAGFLDNGSVPVAYAIFSTPSSSPSGHTGIVLGVDEQNGKAYFGEAFCNSSGFTAIYPKVVTYDLAQVTNGTYTYAYPGEMLKLGGI